MEENTHSQYTLLLIITSYYVSHILRDDITHVHSEICNEIPFENGKVSELYIKFSQKLTNIDIDVQSFDIYFFQVVWLVINIRLSMKM